MGPSSLANTLRRPTVNINSIKRPPHRRRLGRLRAVEVAVAVAILMACIGAAVGVAFHENSTYRFAAEAAIVVHPRADAGELNRYAAAASLPQVVSGARAAAHSRHSAATIRENTSVVVVPSLRTVLIRVRYASNLAALALANALGERALEFVETNLKATADGTRHVGGFESGLEQWGLVRSAFNSTPVRVRQVEGAALFGSGSLQVTCPPRRACGPSRRLYGSFHEGVSYSISGWVRSQSARTPVTLVLGASGADVGVGRARNLSASWHRLVASWTPRADAGSAEIAFQSTSPRTFSFEIDAVALMDPLAAAAGNAPRRQGRLSRSPRPGSSRRCPWKRLAGHRPSPRCSAPARGWPLRSAPWP